MTELARGRDVTRPAERRVRSPCLNPWPGYGIRPIGTCLASQPPFVIPAKAGIQWGGLLQSGRESLDSRLRGMTGLCKRIRLDRYVRNDHLPPGSAMTFIERLDRLLKARGASAVAVLAARMFTAVALVSFVPGPGLAQPPSPPTIDAVRLEGAARSWMQKHGAPALSVAIALDGEPVWSAGFGFSDPEHAVATSRTSYRLASVTKSITATAVMMLAEQGALDLDAPVQLYCPAYPAKRWPVTARLLLAHLGGVRHHSWREAIWPNTKRYTSVAAALEKFKDDDLEVEPGTQYLYSSPGYVILGCAIEGASGMSYERFVQERIFAPAGMVDTVPASTRASAATGTVFFSKGRLFKATGWLARRTQAPPIDVSDRLPAGGFMSTVDDMVRFALAVQHGRLVQDSTREQMWTRQRTADGKPLPFYGLGWLVGEPDPPKPKRVWNDGSQPGTRTFLYLQPTRDVVIALATNMDGAACEELVPVILEIIGPRPDSPVATQRD
jgi:serine beta-lactamase-like protein LACTB